MWNGVLRCFSSFGAGSNNGKRLGVSQVHLLWISLTLLSSVNSFFFAKTNRKENVSLASCQKKRKLNGLSFDSLTSSFVYIECLALGLILTELKQIRGFEDYILQFIDLDSV